MPSALSLDTNAIEERPVAGATHSCFPIFADHHGSAEDETYRWTNFSVGCVMGLANTTFSPRK